MIEIIFAIIFLLLAFLLFNKSYKTIKAAETIKRRYKIPDGEITYTDLDRPAKPLFSKKFRIVGKPDYIVRYKEHYIPVEVKDVITDKPFKNHVLQLAAYCLLVEEVYNTTVPYGVIAYTNEQFKIPFDRNLRIKLQNTIKKMRNELKNKIVERNHNFINRCIFCSFRDVCDFKIS